MARHRHPVISDVWLTKNDDFRPGAEVFRSDRTFELLAFVRSHGQLLLSSDRDAGDRPAETMIQICFKPVDAGPLRNARYLEPLAGLNIYLGYGAGHGTAISPAWIRKAA